MKIIVMNSADLRIEVLNVPDHMLEEDIEVFLAEHDYSLNNTVSMKKMARRPMPFATHG